MAMVKCRECGAPISSEAGTCPHCGIKRPAPESRLSLFLKLGLGGVLIFSMVRCINDQQDREQQLAQAEAAKSPEDRARERVQAAESEARYQSVVTRLRALKAASKNPASFELVDALLMPDGTLCAVHRGTNSFNAVVTEHTAVATSLQVVAWNRYCAGKSGTDVASARRAL